MLGGLTMTRSSKKPTINQLLERIEHLEGAMAEAQQFISMIANSARNDIIRHNEILEALCDNTGVIFTPHPEPETLEEEKVEESIGESE
tara:strand:- start:884 stop:1150 length:267 start_codon:yes stop_codon:yes gene_type:complete